jgi:cholest-4-en-3-one 26-monooxygenase
MTKALPVDLTSASTFANGHPWDAYRWFREHAPVCWHAETDGPGFWVLSHYDDVRTISRQPKLYSSFEGGVMMDTPDPASLAAQRFMMLNMDPPEHDRFRFLVSRGFTPKGVASLADPVHALGQP